MRKFLKSHLLLETFYGECRVNQTDLLYLNVPLETFIIHHSLFIFNVPTDFDVNKDFCLKQQVGSA